VRASKTLVASNNASRRRAQAQVGAVASAHARLVGARAANKLQRPSRPPAGRRSGRAVSLAEPEAAATGSRGGGAGRPAAGVFAGFSHYTYVRDASRGSCYNTAINTRWLLPRTGRQHRQEQWGPGGWQASLCLVPSRGSRRGGGTSVLLTTAASRAAAGSLLPGTRRYASGLCFVSRRAVAGWGRAALPLHRRSPQGWRAAMACRRPGGSGMRTNRECGGGVWPVVSAPRSALHGPRAAAAPSTTGGRDHA